MDGLKKLVVIGGGCAVLAFGVLSFNKGFDGKGGGLKFGGGGMQKQTTGERYEYYHDKNGNLMKKTTTWYIRK